MRRSVHHLRTTRSPATCFPTTRSPARRPRRVRRPGITLLEVVLALAIAAIAMALLAQLVQLGNAAAIVARDSSKAQIIAESLMAEVVSGVRMPVAESGTWELDPLWNYTISVGTGPSESIYAIQVLVEQNIESRPVSFGLTQWLAIPPEPEEETESTEDAGGAV